MGANMSVVDVLLVHSRLAREMETDVPTRGVWLSLRWVQKNVGLPVRANDWRSPECRLGGRDLGGILQYELHDLDWSDFS